MNIQSLSDGSKAVITRAQAAEILECDPRTVSRGIEEGTISAIRLGKRVLILVEPLLAQLAGKNGVEPNGI
jgi:excisionase family DNA binding protein